MEQIPIEEMDKQAINLARTVHEQRVTYVITDHDHPIAVLSPLKVYNQREESTFAPRLLDLIDSWLAEDIEDEEMPLDEFISFIEHNRLDFGSDG
jgi:antitoxin (DNA-binding transcriptional repressor) of toxin-antitoxin stability system